MTSAQRKLARGIEHVNALRADARTFENSQAYVLRTERKNRSPQEIEYRCFAVERHAPPDHWPLLAGEAIQNLRSALDHAVYAVSGGSARSQFPIFTDEAEFKKRGSPMIAGAPKPVRALIERRQPYNAIPDGPEFDALAVLRELSNLDKHRALTTVACAIDIPYFGHSGGILESRFTDVGANRPLHEGAQIMAFVIRADDAEQVKVNPDFRYEVRIEGRPLASTLVAFAQRVYECVVECEGGRAIAPSAEYPIYPA